MEQEFLDLANQYCRTLNYTETANGNVDIDKMDQLFELWKESDTFTKSKLLHHIRWVIDGDGINEYGMIIPETCELN
jgi:hypothetical protein|tara:strand:+ start:396 stop:626 length:231 start_codon:yes stop_codon:yes gene_type:complete